MWHQRSLLQNKRLFLILVCVALAEVLICMWVVTSWQMTPRPGSPRLIPAEHQTRYITVEYTSQRRLGNLLFDYASMMGIAHSYNFTPIMPRDFPALDVFDLNVKVVKDVFQWFGMWSRYRESKAAVYDTQISAKLPKHPYSLVLNGFFQSWKYFTNVEKDLRKHFQFKDKIIVAANIFLEKHTKVIDNVRYTRVGIHIRRGDILTAPDIIKKGYTTPDEQYYRRAIEYFRSRHQHVQFFACTDSADWVGSHLVDTDLVISPGHSERVDLAILSLCDHVIISVGTFGWWGAWLANGTTVYYDDWPQKGTFMARQVNTEDYFPPHWIPMH